MNPSSPEVLEGRLIAQRKVLSEILVLLAQQNSSLLEVLEERTIAGSSGAIRQFSP